MSIDPAVVGALDRLDPDQLDRLERTAERIERKLDRVIDTCDKLDALGAQLATTNPATLLRSMMGGG